MEVKDLMDVSEQMPVDVFKVFAALAHDETVAKLGAMFNMPSLEHDPYAHGAGVHNHPRNGRLNMHVDYEEHPVTSKFRRLNVILYCNTEWREEWGGDTQLWDKDMQTCVARSYPRPNHAIVFSTSGTSWHGVPDKILCPPTESRRTLAFYYVSRDAPPADGPSFGSGPSGYRNKAAFVKRPQDPEDPRMQELFAIRPQRRITDDDMKRVWPEWHENL